MKVGVLQVLSFRHQWTVQLEGQKRNRFTLSSVFSTDSFGRSCSGIQSSSRWTSLPAFGKKAILICLTVTCSWLQELIFKQHHALHARASSTLFAKCLHVQGLHWSCSSVCSVCSRETQTKLSMFWIVSAETRNSCDATLESHWTKSLRLAVVPLVSSWAFAGLDQGCPAEEWHAKQILEDWNHEGHWLIKWHLWIPPSRGSTSHNPSMMAVGWGYTAYGPWNLKLSMRDSPASFVILLLDVFHGFQATA